jgi:4-amino-4-deoxy-L-arabinose transferase-like glycosyltransferase
MLDHGGVVEEGAASAVIRFFHARAGSRHRKGDGLAELPFLAGEQCKGPLLFILFFVSAAVIIVWGIWEGTFPSSSEVIHAETAREVLETGDWWTLHFNGRPVYGTPPIAIWLMAVSIRILGPTEFASRLVFTLFSVLTLYLVYRVGRLSAGAGEPRGRWMTRGNAVGLLSAAILASSSLFGRLAPHVDLNVPYAFFVMLALVGWMRLPDERSGLLPWAVGIAGGVLSAGAGGLLLAAAALVSAAADVRRRALWRRPDFIAATAAALVVGFSWLLPATLRDPESFSRSDLWSPVLGFARARSWHIANLFQALSSLWLRTLPWSIPVTVALVRIAFLRRGGARGLEVRGADTGLVLFSIPIFFSAALGKPGSADALLPLVPVAAVLSAREIGRWMAAKSGEGAGREEAGTAGLWSCNQAVIAVFCLLMLLLVATPLKLHKVNNEPIRDVARMAKRITPDGTRLVNYRQRYDVQAAMLLFYGQRALERPVMEPEELARRLSNDPHAVVLASAGDLNDLRKSPRFPYHIRIIYRSGDLALLELDEDSGAR